jgi:hypothetical protein
MNSARDCFGYCVKYASRDVLRGFCDEFATDINGIRTD